MRWECTSTSMFLESKLRQLSIKETENRLSLNHKWIDPCFKLRICQIDLEYRPFGDKKIRFLKNRNRTSPLKGYPWENLILSPFSKIACGIQIFTR